MQSPLVAPPRLIAIVSKPSEDLIMPDLPQEAQPALVLVFDSVAKVKGQSAASAADKKEALEEYDRLIQALRKSGLQTQTFEAEPGSGKVLIFVRPEAAALAHAANVEKANDYLHGVKSGAGTPLVHSRTSSLPANTSAAATGMTAADRLRHTVDLVTLPPCEDKVKAWHTVSGANAAPQHGAFPRVIDLAALHDERYNKAWLHRWTSPSALLRIGINEIDDVRKHFGEQVALYFGFLVFYFNAQLPLAALGLVCWASGLAYSPIYSMSLVLWACVTVEAWRMRERKFAVRWGCFGVTSAQPERRGFQPRLRRRDPATGEEEAVFEWWRRELRMSLAVPVIAFFAAVLGATMTSIFILEVFIAKIYKGTGHALVPFAPTALFTVAVPQILAAWHSTASALTRFENHRTDRAHSRSMTLKMFALQGFVAYGALTLSAFVYIPFGQTILDKIIGAGYLSESIAHAVKSGDLKYNAEGQIQFDINADRMHTQLFAVSVTSQAVNAFTELVLPILLRKVADWRKARAHKGSNTSDDKPGLVQRTLKELQLPRYEVFTDYAEMCTQFGYIVLWSTVWPLTSVMGFVNNFFEIRGDAAKTCLNTRRPIPQRVESIGPWLEVLGFLAWLSAMMNAGLVYMFESEKSSGSGTGAYATVMRRHGASAKSIAAEGVHHASLSDSLPIDNASPRGSAVLVALLLALASEHGYALARSGVRHILERALWRVSPEHTELERREWQSRRNLLHSYQGGKAGLESGSQPPPSSFWDQPDQGRNIIDGSRKAQ